MTATAVAKGCGEEGPGLETRGTANLTTTARGFIPRHATNHARDRRQPAITGGPETPALRTMLLVRGPGLLAPAARVHSRSRFSVDLGLSVLICCVCSSVFSAASVVLSTL